MKMQRLHHMGPPLSNLQPNSIEYPMALYGQKTLIVSKQFTVNESRVSPPGTFFILEATHLPTNKLIKCHLRVSVFQNPSSLSISSQHNFSIVSLTSEATMSEANRKIESYLGIFPYILTKHFAAMNCLLS